MRSENIAKNCLRYCPIAKICSG